jgi:hypothetical protein
MIIKKKDFEINDLKERLDKKVSFCILKFESINLFSNDF